MTARGKVRFLEALFPGYLFVLSPLVSTRRLMDSVPGVRGVVKIGGKYATVPTCIIKELKNRFPQEIFYEPDPELMEGVEVSILQGPFSNLNAVISSRIPGSKRVAVLLEILGREVNVSMSEDDILPSGYQPRQNVEKESS